MNRDKHIESKAEKERETHNENKHETSVSVPPKRDELRKTQYSQDNCEYTEISIQNNEIVEENNLANRKCEYIGPETYGYTASFDNNNNSTVKDEIPVLNIASMENGDADAADSINCLLRIPMSIDFNTKIDDKPTDSKFLDSQETIFNNITDAVDDSVDPAYLAPNECSELPKIRNDLLVKSENDLTNASDLQNTNSAENLILNLDTQEWLNISELNLDEFENIVYDLKCDNSPGLCDFEEPIPKYVVDKQENIDEDFIATPHEENFKQNTCLSQSYEVINELEIEFTPTVQKEKKEAIYVSSEEETDLDLNLSFDDLDAMPLSLIKALCDDDEVVNKECELNKTDSEVTIAKAGSLKDCKEMTVNEGNKAKISNSLTVKRNNNKKPKDNANIQKKSKHASELEKKHKTRKMQEFGKISDNIETISISSNDSLDSFCSGYLSTDFEFITEEQAKSDGLIINYDKTDLKTDESTCRTIEVTADWSCNEANHSQSSEEIAEIPGPSTQTIKDSGTASFDADFSYRQNHEVPQGAQYLDLFQGIYAPMTTCMYENKSMGPLMAMEYKGLGFDMRLMSRKDHEPDDKYKEEADDIAKKILYMYPEENKKRRRRF